jgi:glutathione S-transferase/GST-like protein
MPKPDLYHWEPNANSGKPIIALLEKGVEFESRYTDLLNFDQHKPDYLAINPNGTIPVLVHGDVILAESTEMGEYIDAAFPGPSLRPDDPAGRWRLEHICRPGGAGQGSRGTETQHRKDSAQGAA